MRHEPQQTDPAVAAVTDHRVVVYAPRSDARTTREQRFPIHFTDIEQVTQIDLGDTVGISIRLTNGDRWQFPVPDADPNSVESATRYIKSGATVYSRAHSAAETVYQSRGQLLAAIREDGNWRLAQDRYNVLSERVDDARRAAEGTPFEAAPSLEQTLEQAERSVETEYTSALLTRIDQLCRTGTEQFERGDIEAGCETLQRAVERYRAILDRLGSTVSDLFSEVFGSDAESSEPAHRARAPLAADSLHRALGIAVDRLASLGTTALDVVGIEPDGFDDIDRIATPEETIEPLEQALAVYRTVLWCVWGIEEIAPIARQALQQRVESTAESLIEAHRRVAEREEWAGCAAQDDEDYETAARKLSTAHDHYQRAVELASEFRTGDPAPLRANDERVVDLMAALPPLRPAHRDY